MARLWAAGRISADELWRFAYQDAGRTKLPEVIAEADVIFPLSDETFIRKYELITELYGFDSTSWEGMATPSDRRVLAFRRTRPDS